MTPLARTVTYFSLVFPQEAYIGVKCDVTGFRVDAGECNGNEACWKLYINVTDTTTSKCNPGEILDKTYTSRVDVPKNITDIESPIDCICNWRTKKISAERGIDIISIIIGLLAAIFTLSSLIMAIWTLVTEYFNNRNRIVL